jgi:hypothetical protein
VGHQPHSSNIEGHEELMAMERNLGEIKITGERRMEMTASSWGKNGDLYMSHAI